MRFKSILILLAVLISTAALAQWTALKGPAGGSVTKIKRDPVNSKLYALASNNLYVSDFGDTWTPVAVPGAGEVFEFAVNGNELMVVQTASYYSSDGGTNWTKKNNPDIGYFDFFKSRVGNYYFVRDNYGSVRISVDGGATFKVIWVPDGSNSGAVMDLKQASNGDLYAMDWARGVIKLPFPSNPDDPASWSSANWVTVHPHNTASKSAYQNSMALVIDPSDKIYTLMHDDAVGLSFEVSTNGGTSWNTLPMTGYTSPPASLFRPVFTISPAGKLLVADTGHQLWEYTDGAGTPWVLKPWPTAIRSDQDIHCITFRNTDMYVGGEVDGIFKSSNSGASWAQSADGMLKGNSSNAIVLDNNRIIVTQGTNPPGFYYSLNNGDIWTFKATTFKIARLVKLPDNTLFASDDSNGVHVSSDGGDTWTDYTATHQVKQFVVLAANDVYGFGDNGFVFETIDKAQTQTPVSINGLPPTFRLNTATRDADGNFYILIYIDGSGGEAWKLNSTTTPWTATKLTTPLNLGGGEFYWSSFVVSNKLYVTDGGRDNYVATNHGSTWKRMSMPGYLMPIAGGLAASTEGNISITQDDGLTVRNVQLPVSSAAITQLATNAAGGFYVASASQSPVLKFTGTLTLPTASLQPYINYAWQTVPGGPFGGEVSALWTTSTGTLFAASIGNLYRYDNANSTWVAIPLSGTLVDLVIDASDNIYGLVTTTGSQSATTIVKSTDGITFSVQSSLAGYDNYPHAITKTASGSIFVATSKALYKSIDDAVTFNSVNAGEHFLVEASPNGTLLALLSNSNKLIRSIDNGVTWTDAITGIDAGQHGLVIATAESNTFITLTEGNVYRSTDDAATWVSIKGALPDSFNSRTSAFMTSPTGDYLMIWNGYYYGSTNHGTSWTQRNSTRLSGLSFNVVWKGTDLYAGSSGGVYKSTDNATTFQPFNAKGIVSRPLYQLELVGSRLVVYDQFTNQVLVSDDQGATWTVKDTGLSFQLGFIKAPDNALYAFGSGVRKSTDQGNTWTEVAASLIPKGTVSQLSTADGITFYAFIYNAPAQGGAKFYKTTDLVNWAELPATGWDPSFQANDMVNDATTLYVIPKAVGVTGGIYQIAFGVASSIDDAPDVTSLKASSNGTIYGLTDNGTLYEKPSSGSWTHKAIPYGFFLSVAPRGQLYIASGTSATINVSRDDGVTWQDVGPIPPQTIVYEIVSDEFTGTAYASTRGAGVMKSTAVVYPDDKTGPVRTVTSPVDNATTVAIDSKLSITFDEAAFPVSGKNLRVYVAGAVNAAYVIDATQATRADKTYTFTLPSSLIYSTNYYVVIDNGAFKDLFGNAYTGISDQTSWNFTTVDAPDTQAPQIELSSGGGNLVVGSGNLSLKFSVTDNKSVLASSAKFYVRDVTSTADFSTPTITPSGTGASVTFDVAVTENTYQKMGVAYYFEVTDQANNKARYPAGNVYAYSYLTYPQSKNPTLPALPTGGSVEDYRMISLPYQFEDNKISTLFSALGEPDNKAWRLLTHGGGSTTNWLEYSSGGITTIERGTGYWINVKNATTISFNGSSVAANNPSAWFSMLLKPGWNQIGDPYTIQISWDEIRATNSNIGKLKVLKDNAYSDSPTLDPYGAGFVFLSGSAPVSIPITFPGFSAGRIAGVQFGTDLGSDIWKLPITIEQGNATSNFSGIGMHNDASEDFDGFDDLNPPPFVKLLQVNFPHPQSDPKKLALDIVPTQAGHQWSFTVDTDTNEEVKLSWDNSGLGNNSKEIFLLDENSQTLVNMRDVSSYSFKPITSHPFKLFFGENLGNRIMPTRILTGDPYPNPTNGLVSLPFTLSEDSDDYRVSLDIMDVMGRPVGRMADQIMSPGFHTTTWMADETTTTGLYLLRIKIQGKEKSYVETKRIVLKR